MAGGNNQGGGKPSTQVVFELLAAIGDGRIEDMLALVHPEVVCQPIVRPGLSQYFGHPGMVDLVANLEAAYGHYWFQIDDMTADGETRVVVRGRVIRKTDEGDMVLPSSTIIYTVTDGLVAFIESEYQEKEEEEEVAP
jgi:hypothetical protein